MKNGDKKREISPHVGSRWYRAPEIALLIKQYDMASDMWSFGCCLYELLTMKEEQSKSARERVLFAGDSCYPLSPKFYDESEQIKYSKNDQIKLIIENIDELTQNDMSFVHDMPILQKHLERFKSNGVTKISFV